LLWAIKFSKEENDPSDLSDAARSKRLIQYQQLQSVGLALVCITVRLALETLMLSFPLELLPMKK